MKNIAICSLRKGPAAVIPQKDNDLGGYLWMLNGGMEEKGVALLLIAGMRYI